MNFREQIKETLIETAYNRYIDHLDKNDKYTTQHPYQFIDSETIEDSHEMDAIFNDLCDDLQEKYGTGYDLRFWEIVQWCKNRYYSDIENRMMDLIT